MQLLQQLMESSPIGQFGTRLSLLEELHRHFTGLHQTQYQQLSNTSAKSAFLELTSVVWNSLVYYRQFITTVNTRIKNLSSPIEKRVKDFIKISRWNDANFWALRDSVKKSQKTLSKLVSDYKKVLLTPVSTVLTTDPSGMMDSHTEKKRSKLKTTKVMLYLMPEEWTNFCRIEKFTAQQILPPAWSKHLSKLQKYYEKSRIISQEIMTQDEVCFSQIGEVDELSVTIIERVHELQNLEVKSFQPNYPEKLSSFATNEILIIHAMFFRFPRKKVTRERKPFITFTT